MYVVYVVASGSCFAPTYGVYVGYVAVVVVAVEVVAASVADIGVVCGCVWCVCMLVWLSTQAL